MREIKKCCNCGKMPLSRDEIGLYKKLIESDGNSFLCLDCMAEDLEVTISDLSDKIDEFKAAGCVLFK